MNAIEYPGTPNAMELEGDMVLVLNLCADSPASAAVEAYQSQASKISQVGDQLAALASQTDSSSSPAVTAAPSVTGTFNTNNPSWTTSPGAAAYMSELAAGKCSFRTRSEWCLTIYSNVRPITNHNTCSSTQYFDSLVRSGKCSDHAESFLDSWSNHWIRLGSGHRCYCRHAHQTKE